MLCALLGPGRSELETQLPPLLLLLLPRLLLLLLLLLMRRCREVGASRGSRRGRAGRVRGLSGRPNGEVAASCTDLCPALTRLTFHARWVLLSVGRLVGWLVGCGFDLPCNVCLQVRCLGLTCALSAPLPLSHTVSNVLYRTVLLLSLQVRRLGLKCALSAKANEGRLILLDSLAPTGRPKTRIMAGGYRLDSSQAFVPSRA